MERHYLIDGGSRQTPECCWHTWPTTRPWTPPASTVLREHVWCPIPQVLHIIIPGSGDKSTLIFGNHVSCQMIFGSKVPNHQKPWRECKDSPSHGRRHWSIAKPPSFPSQSQDQDCFIQGQVGPLAYEASIPFSTWRGWNPWGNLITTLQIIASESWSFWPQMRLWIKGQTVLSSLGRRGHSCFLFP